MTLKLNGSSSGSVSLDAPASGGDPVYKLPGADGTAGQVLKTDGSGNLSWYTPQPAIVIDRWRNNQTDTSNDNHVVLTWERGDTTTRRPGLQLQGGSGMGMQNGIFTFPSTGIWEVVLVGTFAGQSGNDGLAYLAIEITSDDGSNWYAITGSKGGSDATEWFQGTTSAIVDITDVSEQKIRTKTGSFGYTNLRGDTDQDETHLTFIRWGDT